MDAARCVWACDVLDDRAEDDECGACPEGDECVEERKDVLVVDEWRYNHRDGRRNGGKRDKACFHEVLGRLCGTDGANDVADSGEDECPLEKRCALRTRHVLRNHDEELRYAPECCNAEHRELEHRVRPGRREIAHGGAKLHELVLLADADAERRNCSEKSNSGEDEREERVANGRAVVRTVVKCEEGYNRDTERHENQVLGVDLHEVVPVGDFFHEADFGRIENREENAVQEQECKCAKVEPIAKEERNQQNGDGHADGRPTHDLALGETAGEVTCHMHHDDAWREHGELEE